MSNLSISGPRKCIKICKLTKLEQWKIMYVMKSFIFPMLTSKLFETYSWVKSSLVTWSNISQISVLTCHGLWIHHWEWSWWFESRTLASCNSWKGKAFSKDKSIQTLKLLHGLILWSATRDTLMRTVINLIAQFV